jgi:glycosyltransferase involved in cell wall biosynthesis
MNRGGVETWLMHILRTIDRERFKIDFVVDTEQPCAYDDEIRALGSNIIPCVHPKRPWSYTARFMRILRERGPYQIVHSHEHHYSGYILWLAQRAGVPVRIAHSHLDTSQLDARAKGLRLAYLRLMRHLIARHATLGLGVSSQAAAALFGPRWETDRRWKLLWFGIDLSAFEAPVDRNATRAELGIPAGAFVIGHAGRFAGQKNHAFLLDIAAEVARRQPNMRLLLLGEGPLRPAVEQQAMRLGLQHQVVFAGARPDVPKIMRGAMDLAVFPSLYEGLPLVGLELQAAGIPALLSDVITTEMDVVPSLVHRMSLAEPAARWADEALAMRRAGPLIAQTRALSMMRASRFSIEHAVKALSEIYGYA